jgi:hypothetical protein
VALLVGAALAWVSLVPPARARARALGEERAGVERERGALARRVELLERQRGLGAAAPGLGGRELGPVELRARVVEALAELDSGRGIRLDVEGSDGGGVSLALAGELREVLSLIETLTHPEGPVVVSSLELRPSGEQAVQLRLEGVQPGAEP